MSLNVGGLIEELENNAKQLEENSAQLKQIIEIIKKNEKEEKIEFKNFFDIYISGKIIKIPKIQRNYVQGKNKKIREQLMEDIFYALENEEPLNLDIIYGIVEDNSFIPIDGQQRLTTLYLLHWFVSIKENGLEELEQQQLKINYETRKSSKEFFNMLVNNQSYFETTINDNKNMQISKIIKDSIYYFDSKWKNDITVQSALEMLDEIQLQYNKVNKQIKNSLYLIQFSCKTIGIEDEINPDELYIKMNSRGKQLNQFEIYKSYLEKIAANNYMEQNNEFDYEKFCKNINNKWTNDILKTIPKEERKNNLNLVEQYFYNLIRLFLINFFTEQFIQEEDNEKREKKLKYITSIIQQKETYDLGKEEEQIINLNKTFFTRFTNVMNHIEYMCKEKAEEKITIAISKIWKELIGKNDNRYDYILKFYAIMKYVERENCDIKDNYNNFKNWLRIIRNFIEIEGHIQIENQKNKDITSVPYFKIFKTITKLSEKLKEYPDIIEYFEKVPFDNNIFDENEEPWYELEKTKAKLYFSNEEWRKEIIYADNILYLAGRIGFIFDYAKKGETHDIKEFRNYRKLMSAIFYNYPEEKPEKYQEEYLLQKSMLSDEGCYFPNNNGYETFLNFYDNDNTNVWKIYLNNEKELKEKFRRFAEKYKLLDFPEDETLTLNNVLEIEQKLKAIKQNYKDNKNWKYYFINSNIIFRSAEKARIVMEKQDEYFENVKINVLRTQGNSKQWDYITRYLEEKIDENKNSTYEVFYVGKTGATGLNGKFIFENSLTVKNKKNDKEKYVFIRENDGEFLINLVDDIYCKFNIYYEAEKKIDETQLEHIKEIIGIDVKNIKDKK